MIEDDFVLGSRVPFVRGVSNGDIGSDQATEAFITWGGPANVFGANRVVIQGQGAGQRSVASVLAGTVAGTANPQTAALTGFARGSSLTSATAAGDGSLMIESDMETIRDGTGVSGHAFYGATAPL